MKYKFTWWRLHQRHELVDTEWKIWYKTYSTNKLERIAKSTNQLHERLIHLKGQGAMGIEPSYTVIKPQRKMAYSMGPPYIDNVTFGRIRFHRKSDALMFKLAWVANDNG